MRIAPSHGRFWHRAQLISRGGPDSYLQSRFLTRYASISTEEWFSNPQSLAGVLLFFAGMYINIDADAILRGLRRGPDDKGYYVPMVRAHSTLQCS